MSKAFVQGKDRPSMPDALKVKPKETVTVKWHGKMPKTFEIPMPVAHRSGPTGTVQVNADRTLELSQSDAAYALGLGGCFTRVEPVVSPITEENNG